MERKADRVQIDINRINNFLKTRPDVFTISCTNEQMTVKRISNNPEMLKQKKPEELYVWQNKKQCYAYIPYARYLLAIEEKEEKDRKEAEEKRLEAVKKQEQAQMSRQKAVKRHFNDYDNNNNYNNGYYNNGYYNNRYYNNGYYNNGYYSQTNTYKGGYKDSQYTVREDEMQKKIDRLERDLKSLTDRSAKN
jgi:hypothetical protein